MKKGTLLRAAIRKTGMTQKEAATRLGMTRQNLNLIFAKDYISNEFLAKVNKNLGIDLNEPSAIITGVITAYSSTGPVLTFKDMNEFTDICKKCGALFDKEKVDILHRVESFLLSILGDAYTNNK